MAKQRMAILADGEFDDDQTAISRSYRVNGSVINVVRLFARFMPFFRAYKPFGLHGMSRAALDPRVRELAILRIAVLNRCDYEWGHHVRMGQQAGLSAEEVDRVRRGSEDPDWSPDDALVLRATDAIRHDAQLDDATYERLLSLLGETQLFELLVAVGNYNLVSTILNVAGVPLEPGIATLNASILPSP